MSVTPIVLDPRTVATIAFSPGNDGFAYAVGTNGVSRIVAYWENGMMAPVPWFAVFIGDEIMARVPAQMVFISYQPSGTMQ